MRNELYRLQMLEQELSSKYTDEHFAVQQARERAAAAKKVLEAEEKSHSQVTDSPNPVYAQTQLELVKLEPLLTSLKAKASSLRSQLAEVRQQIKTFNADEMQIAQLTRDLKRYETNYQSYAEHLEQTRIDQALQSERISSINVIQPATFEPKPVGPKFLMNLCLGLAVGLIGAVGLPLAAESRELSHKRTRHAENGAAHSTVASVPRFTAEHVSGNGQGNGNGHGETSADRRL
jgi:uncharacterized protein involved in exopolysaccharide biosynthesis